MPNQKLGDIVIEDARLLFRNFAGDEKPFNEAGKRNFCIILPPDKAQQMEADGWNVKELKARDEGDEPEKYIQVTVNYSKGRPPRCVMLTSRGRQDLGADEVGVFDWADIKTADVVLNPYPWEVSGKKGVKAYLKSIFVTLNEDPLTLKYADVVNANQTPSLDDEDDYGSVG